LAGRRSALAPAARRKETPVLVLWIVIGVVAVIAVLLVLWAIGMFNGLVRARLRVREAWSGIDVQLKRRASLVPNLVETVKGYAQHEREVFENVTRARAMLQQAGNNPAAAAEANNMLTQTLRSLFAVAEAYPDLKANQNFLDLQHELSDIEEKIAFARQFYNTNVLSYNAKTATFPSVIFAGMFGFQPAEFFEAEAEAREDVHVSFSTPPAAPTTPSTPASS
jgi:LemA protein